MSTQIKFPTSRVIGGSVYKGRPRESNGQPLYVKGSNPPVQQVSYSLGLAIPKGAEQDWKQTEWGLVLLAEGKQGHPHMCASPTFSWKVTDGDSPYPNSLGRIPREQEGYAGNWIVWASNNRPPQLCDVRGQILFEPDAIYTGCWVQTVCNIAPNVVSGTQKPGVYVNLEAVCFIGHGERIMTSTVDVNAIKWDTALPAGASAIPVTPAQPQQPNYAILNPAPPAPAVHVMKGAATDFTYDQMINAGWNDAALIAAGMM